MVDLEGVLCVCMLACMTLLYRKYEKILVRLLVTCGGDKGNIAGKRQAKKKREGKNPKVYLLKIA